MNLDPKPWPVLTTTYTYDVPVTQPPYKFEHDQKTGVFRLQGPDGKVEVFRDKPVRYLVVEPDPETGQWKPLLQRGCPSYLYVCREEREIR